VEMDSSSKIFFINVECGDVFSHLKKTMCNTRNESRDGPDGREK
jgi:hypothetical protein